MVIFNFFFTHCVKIVNEKHYFAISACMRFNMLRKLSTESLKNKFNKLNFSLLSLQVMPVMRVWGQAKVRVRRMTTRTGKRIKRNVAYFQKSQQISLERGSFNI